MYLARGGRHLEEKKLKVSKSKNQKIKKSKNQKIKKSENQRKKKVEKRAIPISGEINIFADII